MEIALENNLLNILKEKVAKGIFGSIDEAVTYAVQFVFVDNKIPQKRIDELNAEIEKGWQDMEQGRYHDGWEVMEELKRRYA